MKNLLSICLILGLFASCSKKEVINDEPTPFDKNLVFTYEGKTYSSNYSMGDDDLFVWENVEVGEMYEDLLASGSVVNLVGDIVNVLSGTKAEALKVEYESKINSFEEKKGLQTKAKEITAFRLSLYHDVYFAGIMKTRTIEDIDKEEEDACFYESVTFVPHVNYSSVPKSLTFVVLRQEENSFYPKYNARLIISTIYVDKYGKTHQQNYVTLSTEDLGYSMKIPDLRKVGLTHVGQVSSKTITHVSVW